MTGAGEAAPMRRRLTVLPLIALIFYDVSGGPFGIEDSVRAGGGALLPILGFLVLPVLWSLPEALVTAELASAFPTNAGYVAWVSAAFGPVAAFLVGFSKWASGTLDNALYPVLFLDYLRSGGGVALSPPARSLAVLALTAALTYLNFRGLHLVGLSALALTAFSLSPFVALTVLALPKIRPSRWLAVDARAIEPRAYFNSMFWNLNYWDKASTLAGEVDEPRKTFPKAVFGAVGLVVGAYLIPLLAGTGALPSETAAEWTDGFFSEVGGRIGGPWLRVWIQGAAAMSNMGLFEAEMSSDSFQLLGMAEMGMIPAIFARRSRHGTPTYSILCSAMGVVILSFMSFQEIIEFLNFLYGLGMLAVFAAFVKLRVKDPDLPRPYRIPVGAAGAAVMCIPPVALITTVMCLASARTLVVSAAVAVAGVAMYYGIERMKTAGCVQFLAPAPPDSLHGSSSSAGSDDGNDVEDVRAVLLAAADEEHAGEGAISVNKDN
ncbi:probable polyamine transporter At3g19553 [Oryza brachyantha]|uniref:probable polyamine transporter At3g19553 n=1 Tax=Oryza brachyantha TaxID=4533 RepID=UPI001ADBD034|nr:probable polyamine transporter At3g19553 [Oryza brachyantha]